MDGALASAGAPSVFRRGGLVDGLPAALGQRGEGLLRALLVDQDAHRVLPADGRAQRDGLGPPLPPPHQRQIERVPILLGEEPGLPALLAGEAEVAHARLPVLEQVLPGVELEHAPKGDVGAGALHVLGRHAGAPARERHEEAQIPVLGPRAAHEEEVHLLVAGRGHRAPPRVELRLLPRAVLDGVAEHGAEARLLGRLDGVGLVVDEDDLLLDARELLREGEADRVRADQDPAMALLPAQAEHHGDERARHAGPDDRHGDHREDERPERHAALDAGVVEADREERGDGGRDDPARADPADEDALLRREVRAPGRRGDRQGPHDEHQHGDHHERRRPESPDVVEAYVGREEHEEQADEERRELLLELDELLVDERRAVAHDDARDRDGGDARLVEGDVRALEDQHREAEDEDVLEALRDQTAPAEEERDEAAADHAHGRAEGQPPGHRREREGDRLAGGAEHDLEGDGGGDGADGVDEHALRLEGRGDLALRPEAREERGDDRGAGDDDERAEEERELPAPAEGEGRDEGGAGRRDQHAEGEELPERAAGAAEAREAEVQPALEEDDRDGEADELVEPAAERVRHDHVRAVGPEGDACAF